MAVTRKVTTTTDTNNIAFQKIPKSRLFADDGGYMPPVQMPPVQMPPVQMAPVSSSSTTTVTRTTSSPQNDEQVIDPTLLLLLSLFNNNQSPAMPYYPYPPTTQGSGNCPNYYPNLPSDISEIKTKLEELKNLVVRTPRTIETTTSNGEHVVYDDSGLYNLINQNHNDSWNKLLDIEGRLIELQNEHYDIYNLINDNANASSNEYYEEYYEQPQPTNGNDEYEEYEEVTTTTTPVDNGDEYYDEYTTTTTEQYDDNYNNQEYADNQYDNGSNEDYYMNKKNYKEFMQTLKNDIKK